MKVLSLLLPLAAGIVLRPDEDEFDRFIAKYNRMYQKGSAEYSSRLATFSKRLRLASMLNSEPGRHWTAGVSPVADFTEEELKRIKGWKGTAGKGAGRSSLNLLQGDLPEEWSKWRSLRSLQDIQNQGGCGSCWAVSSATVLNAHREIYHNVTDQRLSAQELLNCVPNPRNCGGSGGCEGATVELAMDFTLKHGLSSEVEEPYVGSDEGCRKQLGKGTALTELKDDMAKSGVRHADDASLGLKGLKMSGWEKLMENKYEPLKRALVTKGPVAVSVSAHNWDMYVDGIFNGCKKNAVIDHAVVLIAYGKDSGLDKKYWTIQNSWGGYFGEGGTMRLLRQDAEEEYCGVDKQPQMGTGCDGGAPSVKVCGMCGILYDSVVPIF